MAIFLKAYRGYDGGLSSTFDRVMVIFRYAMADVFQSRLFVGYFLVCLLFPIALICALYIYHNIDLLMSFEVPLGELPEINGEFFAIAMQMPQNALLFFMVVAIGPTMISPDLRNNAMPLYLSRPISKSNYILGKLMVLLVLGSLISWIPGLIIFGLQSFLAGGDWMMNNLQIPVAAFVSSVSWILCLSLLAFTVSAFVKWKAVARISFFGILFFASLMGEIIEELFQGSGGYLVNVFAGHQVLMAVLYQASENFILEFSETMTAEKAAVQLSVISIVAFVILYNRIRAYQAVA